MKSPSLKLLGSLRDYLLALPTRWIYNDDVCHPAIKVKKLLKGRKPFQTTSSIHPQSNPKGFFFYNKVNTIPTPIKVPDKGIGIASEPPKRLEGKRWFKCLGHGHL